MKRIPPWLSWALIGAFLVLAFLMSGLEPGNQPPVAEISYTQLRKLIEDGSVASMTLKGEEARAHLKKALPLGPKGTEVEDVATLLPSIGDPSLIPTVEAKGVELTSLPADDGGARRFLYAIAPWLVLIAVYWFFWNRMYRNMAGGLGGRDVTDFLHGSAKREVKDAPQVTFADVAGQDNAKREVAELVDFLKNPEQYRKLGAEPPRGVLMVGPPGTGKTLLARALAGEAGGALLLHLGLRVHRGVRRRGRLAGAQDVRGGEEAGAEHHLHRRARFGRPRRAARGSAAATTSASRRSNQILAEMDGFQGHEAVIVLAATNRPDVLDPALLRPGRFDRHVTLELPDKPAREAILKVHMRKVPLASDVDVSIIASSTPGFSGADLKNLVNEAAMMAAREGETQVAMRHFDEMRDKVMMGSVRTLAIQPEEHHRLAVHESGHTVVAHFLPHADPLYKVTIIPRGRALGATQSLPEEERHTLPEEYLRDRIAVMLGGRTAERELLGSVSTGADDDIRQATALARAMVARWGMSSEIGPMDVRESEEHPFLGREIAQPRHFSDTTAYMVDEAVRRLLLEAEERAAALIREHKPGLMRLIAALEAHETLGRGEIDACLGPGEARVGDARADPKRGPRAA